MMILTLAYLLVGLAVKVRLLPLVGLWFLTIRTRTRIGASDT
jgi:hypothetical protein